MKNEYFRYYIKLCDKLYLEKIKIDDIKKLSIDYPKNRVLRDTIIYIRRKRIRKIKHNIKDLLQKKENNKDNSDKKYEDRIEILETMFTEVNGKINNKKKESLRKRVKNKLEKIFTKDEYYGNMIDIKHIYEKYKILMPEMTYKDYLMNILHLKNFPKNKFEYFFMLKDLLLYFKKFLKNSRPLEKFKVQIENFPTENLYNFYSDNIFCLSCKKSIKENLYEFHSKGKKHIKNLNSEEKILKVEEKEVFLMESEVQQYINLFKQEINNTILVDDNEYKITTKKSLEEKEFIPRDNQGNIIPLWLYKHYGLDVNFFCEICNVKIKGKRDLNKHFDTNLHMNNLENMGVQDKNKFFGILKRKEVEDLIQILDDRKGDLCEDIEEVEDENGNVYDKKTYEDLKRMGML